MTAPNTNVKKQTRRHKGPLFGIAVAIAAAAVLFFGYLLWTASGADTTDTVEPASTADY